MSTLAIFLYGLVVTGLVAAALGLILWGIVAERRDRRRPEQARDVFGRPAAALLTGEGGEGRSA
jgi:hypothetical protein